MSTREEKDKVTVGDIRAVMLESLEQQIETLNKLIRQGYSQRHQAEKYLSGAIGETLTHLDNLDAFAGKPLMHAVFSSTGKPDGAKRADE